MNIWRTRKGFVVVDKNAAMREAIRRGYMVGELLWINQSQNMK